jgi:GNAT superfamily N-acetyltransferase
MDELIIEEISDKKTLLDAFALLKEIYPKMKKQQFLNYCQYMIDNSQIKFLGAFTNNKLVAVASYWIGVRLHSGKFIQIDNMITSRKHRNKQIATKLLNFVKEIGKKENCEKYVLDVFVDNHAGNKLYAKEKFDIAAFHLMQKIS